MIGKLNLGRNRQSESLWKRVVKVFEKGLWKVLNFVLDFVYEPWFFFMCIWLQTLTYRMKCWSSCWIWWKGRPLWARVMCNWRPPLFATFLWMCQLLANGMTSWMIMIKAIIRKNCKYGTNFLCLLLIIFILIGNCSMGCRNYKLNRTLFHKYFVYFKEWKMLLKVGVWGS